MDVTLTYDPAVDFPSGINVNEDSLTFAIWDTTTADLAFIPTTRDPSANTLTAALTNLNTPLVVGVPSAQSTFIEPVADQPLPETFSLHQNYPNPFNPTTTISYYLPGLTKATLTIYDVLARVVRELESGTKPAGTYEVSFDAGPGRIGKPDESHRALEGRELVNSSIAPAKIVAVHVPPEERMEVRRRIVRHYPGATVWGRPLSSKMTLAAASSR